MTLVSVGLPVRNGGPMLRAAIESVLNQSYPDLEIIISDNESSDETKNICEFYAEKDKRITYYRQNSMLTPNENFQFVLNKSRGEYFMWAAHDDLRSPNFVADLIPALRQDRAVLAFGDLFIINSHGGTPAYKKFDFETVNLPPMARIRKQSLNLCYHFYGLWKSSEIKNVPIADVNWGADLLMLTAMAYRGEFVYVRGPKFIYFEIPKTIESIVRNDYKKNPRSRFYYAVQLIKKTASAFGEMGAPFAGAYAGLCISERISKALARKMFRKI